jgi:prevent-host-death family protein
MTMKRWPVQDAKAKFSEFLDACLAEGPQTVTRRGVEAAVLVSIDQWRSLGATATPSLKDLLLEGRPREDVPVPDRKPFRRRSLPELD